MSLPADSTPHSPPDPEQLRQEVERAAEFYYHSPQQLGIDNRTKRLVLERCLPYVVGPRILELGYVDGEWTRALRAPDRQIEVVEGARRHVEHARQAFAQAPDVRIHHCLFQEFLCQEPFHTIVAGDMLRYLDDPLSFLRQCRDWLHPGGRLIATVPNGRSLHRRIGSYLGLEGQPMASNQRDREVGNRRSYDRFEFRHLLQQSGYTIREVRGCFLKPLSSSQMENWDDDLLRAFLEVGNELEDYCWFLYGICDR